MLAILHLLAMFIADRFKLRRRLEVENLFLRHQLNIALRRACVFLRHHPLFGPIQFPGYDANAHDADSHRTNRALQISRSGLFQQLGVLSAGEPDHDFVWHRGRAPWYYYALLLPLIVSFVYIPCSVGAICCLLIIHKLPKLRRIIVAVALLTLIFAIAPLIWRTVSSPQSRLFGNEWSRKRCIASVLRSRSGYPAPGSRMVCSKPRESTVVVTDQVSDLPILQSVLYLALLVSNALFFHVVTLWAAKRWFRESYANFACRLTRNRTVRQTIADRCVAALLFAFPCRFNCC